MHIVDLSFRNFKSYRDITTISFEALDNDFRSENVFSVALKDESSIRLVKSAAIYGANASGKSNVIWAMKALAYMVVSSRNFPVGFKIPFEPFKFDSNPDDSFFSLRFIIDGELYRYFIEFNDSGFTKEFLYQIISGEEHLVFSQLKGHLSVGKGWEDINTLLKDINFLPSHLLLSEIAVKPQNRLQKIYTAIAGIYIRPLQDTINIRANNVTAGRDFLKDKSSSLFNKLSALMRAADFGIVGIDMSRHGDEEFKLPDSVPEEVKRKFIDENRWEFNTFHKAYDSTIIEMPLEEESTGTQNMFGLGALVLKVLEEGGVLFYDEMDVAVHPQLFRFLISLFNSEDTNPNNAQVLFSTHNTIIVNETEGIMRADQIWFSEKNEKGLSSVYSAQDFEDIGIVVPFERWYRLGRFGAVPNIGSVSAIFNREHNRR